jgi:hypothetical protein
MLTLLKQRLAAHLALFIGYFMLACLVTYPLITDLSGQLAGHPFGDSYEIARHAWWIQHALANGQPLFEQPLLLYPTGTPSLYFWGNPLQVFPTALLAFLMPLPAAYNLTLLLMLALNGWTMALLARFLLAQRGADRATRTIVALLAGALYCVYPTMQAHAAAGHLGLLMLWSVPLFTRAALHIIGASAHTSFTERGVLMSAAAVALWFAVGALGSTQMLLFTTLPVAAFLLLSTLLQRRWHAVRRLLLALALGALLTAIFAVPALLETLNAPAHVRDEDGVVRYSADLLAIAAPSSFHPLYAALDYPDRILGADPFEGTAYIGIVGALLALLGVWQRRAARGWLALAAALWLLSLGPLLKFDGAVASLRADGYASGVVLPYAALLDVPLVSILRTPGRFNFALALCIAVMATYGGAALLAFTTQARWRRHLLRLLLVLLALFVVFDLHVWWRDGQPRFPTISAAIPQEIIALRDRSDVRAVFHIPWQHLLVGKDALWLQTGYQQPMIAGHVARRTPLDPARGWLLQTLDPALLRQEGADVVILHKAWAEESLITYARQQLGTPFYEDAALIAWDTPRTESTPAFRAVLPPARPTTEAHAYLWLPTASEVQFRAELTGAAESILLSVDGTATGQWRIADVPILAFPIALNAGYHSLTLTVAPACERVIDPTLACATFTPTLQITNEGSTP